MPEIDREAQLSAALDVKDYIIAALTSELAVTRVLLTNSRAALAAAAPEEPA